MKKFIIIIILLSFLGTIQLYPVRKDTRLILDELQRLEERIKKIELTLAEFNTVKQKVDIIEEKVTAIALSRADEGQGKESIQLALQFIKEELNELKNNIGKINDRLLSGVPTGGSGTATNGSETGTVGSTETSNQSSETIYYTAYSDYIKKNYQYAISGFRQFIELFPNNGLADNSLYWIGECYYSQKMYREAVATFDELLNNYSDGDKIPDAILKKGYALIEMGRQAEGIEVLKELSSRFPLSEEASLAQQKIREIMD